VLVEEFLKPLGISQYRLAKELHVPLRRVNEIALRRRGISADMALRLGRFFGMTAEFWLNLQSGYEKELALRGKSAADLKAIVPFAA
ncbi:MAG: HigA family addiction module antidote protein, partial [Pyramidobacter sp.]|nr:HigA family addiction module antidote protein [Pyramidobacter sp.]